MVIAINENETRRIIKDRGLYSYQIAKTPWLTVDIWTSIKTTTEEWLASKWILDYRLKVSSDYPSIKEIKEKQEGERNK